MYINSSASELHKSHASVSPIVVWHCPTLHPSSDQLLAVVYPLCCMGTPAEYNSSMYASLSAASSCLLAAGESSTHESSSVDPSSQFPSSGGGGPSAQVSGATIYKLKYKHDSA